MGATMSSPVTSHPVLQMFLDGIRPVQDMISSLYLFGSRARGDWRPDSDFDVLVVVPERTRELVDRLYEAALMVNLETSLVISLKIFTTEQHERLSAIPTPFFLNVNRERGKLGFDK
jgi:uncharacterized protein